MKVGINQNQLLKKRTSQSNSDKTFEFCIIFITYIISAVDQKFCFSDELDLTGFTHLPSTD